MRILQRESRLGQLDEIAVQPNHGRMAHDDVKV
jgi:hypothetical protein